MCGGDRRQDDTTNRNNNSNNNDDNDSDSEDSDYYREGLDPCCRIIGRRCLCVPYGDGVMISAQILAFVATSLSWVWWPTLVGSLFGLAIFQLPWFCRQSRFLLYATALVGTLCSLVSLALGIYVSIVFWDKHICDVVSLDSGYWDPSSWNFYKQLDVCREEIWASIAFLSFGFWATAAILMAYFVKSGKHAAWEETHRSHRRTGTRGGEHDNDDDDRPGSSSTMSNHKDNLHTAVAIEMGSSNNMEIEEA